MDLRAALELLFRSGTWEEGGGQGDFQVSGLGHRVASCARGRKAIGRGFTLGDWAWGEGESPEFMSPSPVPPAFSSPVGTLSPQCL